MRILVTGAGRGLGASLSAHLARGGHDVVVHYRSSSEEAQRVVDDIHREGGKAELVQADLGTGPGARGMADRLGNLQGLINNAGALVVKPYDELDDEDWDDMLNANLSSAFHTTRAVLPHLRRQGGRIINITDVASTRSTPRPMTLPYSIAKAGLFTLTKTLAKEEAAFGITVNAIAPGILEHSEPLPDVNRIPAGRYGTADDVAAVVDFLLSDGAAYVTGASIPVSGGWNL